MPDRKAVTADIQRSVLTRSRRRCCLCFGLAGDLAEKQGQIAHLDRDPSNDKEENLAFMCFDHHDRYDSKTSQSKGYTKEEAAHYRDGLYSQLEKGPSDASLQKSDSIVVGDVTVAGSRAPTQVNIGSPGSTQIVNPTRTLTSQIDVRWGNRGKVHILQIVFHQTEGIWASSQEFWVQVQLTGPYKSARFIQGMPLVHLAGPSGPILTTDGSAEAAARGYFELRTGAMPAPGDLVLEVESDSRLEIRDVKAQPT